MGTLHIERRAMPCCHGRLPHYLQECEYIESTGVEYINTNVDAVNLTTHLTFQYVGPLVPNAIIGGCWNWGSRYLMCIATSGGLTYSIEAMQGLKYNDAYDNDKHNILFYTANNHSIYFDDSIKGGSYDDIVYSQIATPYLFASRGQVNAEYFAKARIYSCKMVKNGIDVVREFVPCYVKATGEAGLYDLISKKFFTNQSGNGAFIHGGDV